MARIIGEVRPQYVFVENSPMLTTRGLGVVLADLSSMGFDAKWGVVSAADIGANHQRERIWIRAEQRNFFSHSEHNGARWWQQRSESTKKTAAIADSRCEYERANKELRSEIKISVRQNFTKFCGEMANSDSKRCKERSVLQPDNTTKRIKWCGSKMADSNEYGTQSQSSNTRKSSKWIDSSGIAGGNQDVTNSMQSGLQGGGEVWQTDNEIGQNAELWRTAAKRSWWTTEPNVGRVVNGLAGRVDRLKAIGNGQVPLCAATAWELLK